MTNLEFIEEQIKNQKETIELMKNMIAESTKYPSIKKLNEENLKSVEEILGHLQQIKTIVEAWEVVKPNVVEENIINKEVIKVKCTIYPKGESNGKYEKLKKALENQQ